MPISRNHSYDELFTRYSVGSWVRFTGVYEPLPKDTTTNESFRILVGRQSDIELLREANLVRRDREIWLASGLSALVGLPLVWVVMLRRQVAIRTAEARRSASLLKAATEAIADGMFIFGSNAKLLDLMRMLINLPMSL